MKDLGSDKPDFKPDTDQDWDDYLRQTREEVLKSKFERMFEKKSKFVRKHEQTVEACKRVMELKSAAYQNHGTMLNIAHLFAEASTDPDL